MSSEIWKHFSDVADKFFVPDEHWIADSFGILQFTGELGAAKTEEIQKIQGKFDKWSKSW